MTWLWEVTDMDDRVQWVRRNSPDDFATMLARYVIVKVTLVMAYLLWPFDYVLRLIGKGLARLVLGLLFLMILTAIWFPIWLTLVGTSRLWLSTTWTRPLLLLPGVVLAVLAHSYIMLIPDPQKEPKYVNLVREWPLSWLIWKPPPNYYEETGALRP